MPIFHHRPDAAPRAELLDPVLDPDRLQSKLDELKAARDEHQDELSALSPERRLPVGYLEQLSAAIEAEKSEDPPRVIRAGAASEGVPALAPPRVVYLSHNPKVSQLQSIITYCIEAEIKGAATVVSDLDHLWRDVKHWTAELRDKLRQFGSCDIRWIEPKLAEIAARFEGKHAFNSSPTEVHLEDQAIVIVVGDWATALPKARNTAQRIREFLETVEPGPDCHVIHLGDTYYSGLEDECRRRFLDLWPVDLGSPVHSWTLNGNHDMYSGGYGYFDVLLKDDRFDSQAGCSYFALANDHWQLLGLDSSYNDPEKPDLEAPQTDWLAQRVASASEQRGTILMSHHQPFSGFEDVDPRLANTIKAALGGSRVEGWLWGHEHRCAVYDRSEAHQVFDSPADYTAVIGHGGVPQLLTAQDSHQAVGWELADYYQVADDHWGLGGFAVLRFDGPGLTVQYIDEYGKEARTGPPVAYPAVSEESSTIPLDPRPVRDPDTITPFHLLGADR
jgi:3',5'-cyclic AMP phosphodiesterase CpdA